MKNTLLRNTAAAADSATMQQRREQHLALGLSISGVALGEVDYATGLNHLSVEGVRLFGLGDTAMAVPREAVHATFHPEDVGELMQRIAASLNPVGEGWFAMDHRVIWPTGEVRWLRVRKQIFFEGPPDALRPARATFAVMDVTTEKNASIAIQATDARMQLALEASQLGIWEWNVLTNTIRWDAQMFRLYGVTPTADGFVPYSVWSGSVRPEDLAGQEAQLQKTIRDKSKGLRVFRIQCADGPGYRDIQAVDTVLLNQQGEAEWVLGTNRDITERLAAEAKVRLSEIRYRRLFEAAHDGVLLLDPLTRKITDANPFMSQLLGYPRTELIGMELFHIGLLKDEAASQEMFLKLKRTEEVRYEDLPLKTQSGLLREVEVVANLYDENGSPVIQCNIRDISVRKLAEESQRRNEALFSTLIEQVTVGIYVIDDQFRMLRINSTAMRIFQHISPLIGRDFAEIVHILWPKKLAADIISHFRHTLATGEAYLAPDLSGRRQDTNVKEVYEWSLQRISLPGGGFGVVCFFNNITERKEEEATQRRLAVLTALNRKMERDITRRQAVEDALTASQNSTAELLKKSRLLEIEQRHLSRLLLTAQEEERKRISRELHDVIAQSLAIVNYRLSGLQSKSFSLPEELQQKILAAQTSVEQAVDTVHRFARDLRPSMLDDLGLRPALETYLKDFQQRSHLKVELLADASTEALDSTARTVLYRIAQEALTNIVRHAAATRVTITIQQQPDAVRMEIIDNGIGFTPVPQGTLNPKSNRLGLLGMRERVEMAGGTFAIDSAPGGPTTVRVEIPAAALPSGD
jgi:PAS domain S-box-containing protein